MYLLDIGDEQWVWELQYCGRKYQVSTPEPWENLAVLDREDLMNAAFGVAFSDHRETALRTRPSDAADEAMEQAINKDIRDGTFDEDDLEDTDDDLSDYSTEELREILRKRMEENPDTE
jgi:hypothetical protein